MSGVPTEGGDIMVYLGGKQGEVPSFRCDAPQNLHGDRCGCNVFRRKFGDPKRLVCNSCHATYLTEPK